MNNQNLEKFIRVVSNSWGDLSTELVEKVKNEMSLLIANSLNDDWRKEFLASGEDKVLYKSEEYGFMLLVHSETEGKYRVPHDHGRGWVIYGVVSGEVEMRTYNSISKSETAESKIVRKDSYRMKTGDLKIYLPGDIHDTRCISDKVHMIRFTSCDLKAEDREGKMRRYDVRKSCEL
jgi:hypothetical protein